MPGILVVEDDENLNRGITFSLKKSGYEVFSAESVKKAKRIASDNNVDVTICDVNLPDGNGLEFVRWMRCNYNTYIICLTALDQEMDQVMGYEAGADDYITKPYATKELVARIRSALRRHEEPKVVTDPSFTIGDLSIYPDRHEVRVAGEAVDLTKKEFDLLLFLAKNKNRVLKREEILEKVWGYGYAGKTNIVDVYIRYLRSKIDEKIGKKYIHTVRGIGYVARD